MATIDERVVSMKFDNRGFAEGVKGTLGMLDKLKNSLKFTGATRGLEELDEASKRMNFQTMADGIADISSKFDLLSIVGITALVSIANKAIEVGAQITKALTVAPIMEGFREYETQMNAVQTILANTESKGSTLEDVNGSLDELNTYADKTIYNFTEMTRNIGTFTAAGVDLDKSTSSIKGIANLAALSGSNSQQASTAMYQLSQAMAAGKVSLMDWNSVVNAGMGGQVFQDALKETARNQGIAVDDYIAEAGSFRESLQDGWITTDVMLETLSKMTGDLSDKQLADMGYSSDQIKNIQKLATTASDAATKVKTVTQLWDTLKESVQSGWTSTWEILIGDFEEAKELLTGVSDFINEIVNSWGSSRNELLQGWKDLGGRTDLIDGVKNAVQAIIPFFQKAGEAFREIFPPITAERLKEITGGFKNFTETLKPSDRALDRFKATFKGLFAVVDIVGMVLGEALGLIGSLLGVAIGTSGGVLELTGAVGDFLVGIRDMLRESGGIEKFFDAIRNGVGRGFEILQDFIGSFPGLGDIIEGVQKGAISIGDGIRMFIDQFNPLSKLAEFVGNVAKSIVRVLGGVLTFLSPILVGIGSLFKGLWDTIKEAFSTGNFQTVLDIINTGFVAGIFLAIKKLVDGVKGMFDKGDSGGLTDSIKEVFGGLNDALGAIQANLKAEALIKIAAAVGILSLAILGISLIDSGRLTSALTAITVMFGQLAGMLYLLDSVTSMGAVAKLPFIAAGLILLSGAMVILSGAVMMLSTLSWDELTRGLVGIGVGLLALSAASVMISNLSGPMIRAGIGLMALAVAMNILVPAIRSMGEIPFPTMAMGLIGISAGLALIAVAMQLMPVNMVFTAGALLVVSTSLLVLYQAVNLMAGMTWDEIGRGLAVLGGSLGILALGLNLMSGSVSGSIALGIAAASLLALSPVLLMMSSLGWDAIGRGLAVLGGSLGILALGLALMSSSIPGALAMVVVAGALALLVPQLILLSGLSWAEIGIGLAALAGAFTVFGIAGLALAPVTPILIALGAAIALFGVGVGLAAFGVAAFSIALVALGAAGAAGAAGLTAFITGILNILPLVIQALGDAIISLANVITAGAPAIVGAIAAVLNAIIQAVIDVTPQIGQLIQVLVDLMIQVMTENVPSLAAAGLEMLLAILREIDANIYQVTDTAIDIVLEFLSAIESRMPDVTQKGADLIITFVESMASAIRNNTERMRTAGWDLAVAVADGMTGGLASKAGEVVAKASSIGDSILSGIKSSLRINSPSKETYALGEFAGEGVVNALEHYRDKTFGAAYHVGESAVEGLRKSISKVETPFDGDVDLNPHIRPVIDLSAVEEGARKINDAFNSPINLDTTVSRARNSYSAPESDSQNVTNASSTGTTFIQNNYSPKALSRGDIYRETNTLLAMARK